MNSTLDLPLNRKIDKIERQNEKMLEHTTTALKMAKEALEKSEKAFEMSKKALESSMRVEAKLDSFELFLRRFTDKLTENQTESDGPATKRSRFDAMVRPLLSEN